MRNKQPKRIISLLIILLIASSLFAASAVKYDQFINQATEFFGSYLSSDIKVTLVNVESEYPEFSEELLNDLEKKLINFGCTVLDRKNTDSIVAELEFQSSGLVDDREAVSIGHMLGADMIIVGKATNKGDYMKLELSLIDLSTTLVVRKEEEGIRRYVHLGTGNYNDQTAKLYTDLGLLTCNEAIGEDATAVFNMLSGYSEPDRWNKLVVAPLWMKDRFLHLIAMEEEHAKKGQKAHIIAKMNSLCDRDIIAALYSASAAGVKIDLIIRGICCLKVGIPGVSENITVRSIVGNFLEHARIFYFYSGGNEEVFMGSADWMPRNLEKRVEIVFPVEDEQIKKEVMHILDIQMKDNVKASILQADGTYTKPDKRGKTLVNSQEYFCREATERAEKPKEQENSRVFVPAEPVE